MTKILRKIEQLFCAHEDIRKVENSRVFVKCLKCGKESEGIRL